MMFLHSVLQKPNIQCGWHVREQHVSTFSSYCMTIHVCLDLFHFHMLTTLIFKVFNKFNVTRSKVSSLCNDIKVVSMGISKYVNMLLLHVLNTKCDIITW